MNQIVHDKTGIKNSSLGKKGNNNNKDSSAKGYGDGVNLKMKT